MNHPFKDHFKLKTLLPLTLCLLLLADNSFAQTAREIFLTSIRQTDPENMEMISMLTIEDANQQQRIRTITSARKRFGSTQKMLLRFLSPPEVRGTAMLVFDHSEKNDEMWIYMPALNKVRRIISSEKGKSFMGSEFSNADMSKPNPADYEYEKLPDEFLDGKECYVLDLAAREADIARELGYHRKKIWIDKKTFLTQKIVFFDRAGQALKMASFTRYEQINPGRFLALSMKMENLINHRKSFLEVDKVQAGCELSSYRFVPEKLPNP
jgi:hypothetical protein